MNNDIAIIANNYGRSYDGIGTYAKVISSCFSDELAYSVYTANCSCNDHKIKRFLTFGMTKCLIKCSKELDKYKAILIEYPFVEWNPLILIAFKLLKKKAQKNSIKIILSLHEYRRTNNLKKKVIRYFVKRSNKVFVSNKEMLNDLKTLNINIELRDIPTNIYEVPTEKNKESMNKYVFFGLVNSSKAFKEMIDGWKEFNTNKENTLYVITQSNIKDEEENYGIKYIHGADNNTVFEHMNDCMYCVLPIKPEIDEKNATFKTGAIAGCLCIGKFSNTYKKEDFIIEMNNYTKEDFYKVFKETSMLDFNTLKQKSKKALMFGNKYNPYNIAKVIEDYILKEINS